MGILDKLALEDKRWRKYALKITDCEHLAEDIVQEMYLKYHRTNNTKIEPQYVYMVILNLFRDHLRRKLPTTHIDKVEHLLKEYPHNEPSDVEHIIKTKLKDYDEYYAELALITADGKSLRKIADQYQKHYLQIYYEIKYIKEKLKEDSQIKDLYLSIK